MQSHAVYCSSLSLGRVTAFRFPECTSTEVPRGSPLAADSPVGICHLSFSSLQLLPDFVFCSFELHKQSRCLSLWQMRGGEATNWGQLNYN